jgi:hypothetical protein
MTDWPENLTIRPDLRLRQLAARSFADVARNGRRR